MLVIDEQSAESFSRSAKDTENVDWNKQMLSLFGKYGCTWLRWCSVEAGEKTHAVVAVSDFIRPVSIVPDFYSPVGIEVGSKV